MIKKLLVSGCSIACGFDTIEAQRTKHNICNSYGQHIANALDLQHENIAMPGLDNRHIAQHTVQYLADKDTSEYCVIVGWTGLSRNSFYYRNQLYVWTPNGYPEFCYPYLSDPYLKQSKEKFEAWQQTIDPDNEKHNWYHDIMYLNYYFTTHNIPFLMVNTIQPFEDVNTEVDLIPLNSHSMLSHIKNINTYHIPDKHEGTMWDILTKKFQKEKLFTTKTKHFNIDAHKYLGEYFAPILDSILHNK